MGYIKNIRKTTKYGLNMPIFDSNWSTRFLLHKFPHTNPKYLSSNVSSVVVSELWTPLLKNVYIQLKCKLVLLVSLPCMVKDNYLQIYSWTINFFYQDFYRL